MKVKFDRCPLYGTECEYVTMAHRAAELEEEVKRLRSRLENPTEEMLKAGRVANRLVAGNSLGLACIAPDSAWSAMANFILTEDW